MKKREITIRLSGCEHTISITTTESLEDLMTDAVIYGKNVLGEKVAINGDKVISVWCRS